jgi:hypothetical protein
MDKVKNSPLGSPLATPLGLIYKLVNSVLIKAKSPGFSYETGACGIYWS